MSDRGTAVVTGAGQGIGKAIAVRLIADGYDVLAVDVNAEQVAATAAEIGCRSAVADVSDPAQIASLVALAAPLLPACPALLAPHALEAHLLHLHPTGATPMQTSLEQTYLPALQAVPFLGQALASAQAQ